MPNELPLEPLPPDPLVTKLDADFKNISLDMFYSPFSKPDPLPSCFHCADMILHGLRNRRIADRRVILHQGQGFGFLRLS